MMTLLVNIVGVGLVGLIVWWFWIYKSNDSAVRVDKLIEIKVKDGVYQPAVIEARVNQPITLRFVREDASPCAEMVVFPLLKVSKRLPLGEGVDLVLNVGEVGEYEFTCQMGMYRGRLVVK